MPTKNTLADVAFAENYLEFVSRRGADPESRARARVLIAMMSMLDVKHPTWRTDLLNALDSRNVSRDIEKMFPLPSYEGDSLFEDFLRLTFPSNPSE